MLIRIGGVREVLYHGLTEISKVEDLQEVFSRKGAKTQRRHSMKPEVFLCAFAPLREKSFFSP
jgi:hypothetical protein